MARDNLDQWDSSIPAIAMAAGATMQDVHDFALFACKL